MTAGVLSAPTAAIMPTSPTTAATVPPWLDPPAPLDPLLRSSDEPADDPSEPFWSDSPTTNS